MQEEIRNSQKNNSIKKHFIYINFHTCLDLGWKVFLPVLFDDNDDYGDDDDIDGIMKKASVHGSNQTLEILIYIQSWLSSDH